MARTKAAAYHGIQNMKFAKKTGGTYAAEPILLKYAKSLNPSALLEAVEQHADNRLLFRIPKDDGYEGEIGTTGQDPDFETLIGAAMDGTNGVIRTGLVSYARGALYYEFIERNAEGQASVAKVWMYNVEIGKGNESYTTDTNSAEFGDYTYPFRAYGDPVKAATGDADYLDANGMGRVAMMYISRPGDTGYDTFGATVPVPKAPAAGG